MENAQSEAVVLHLTDNPDMTKYHQYVRDMKTARGFVNNPEKSFVRLTAQVGDLGRAIADTWADNSEEVSTPNRDALSRELADLFIYILDISNQYDINLDTAFRERELENKTRKWKAQHLY